MHPESIGSAAHWRVGAESEPTPRAWLVCCVQAPIDHVTGSRCIEDPCGAGQTCRLVESQPTRAEGDALGHRLDFRTLEIAR